MREVRVLREAAEEVTNAAAHYEDESTGLGVQFEEAIHDSLQILCEDIIPLSTISERLTKVGVKRLIMKRFPYSIVVRELETEVQIIAFAHHSKRPEYWRERLGT